MDPIQLEIHAFPSPLSALNTLCPLCAQPLHWLQSQDSAVQEIIFCVHCTAKAPAPYTVHLT